MAPRRNILHVDMDAFFAAVEQRDDPSLRGKPVVVGARSRRGVVLAASYEARPYGLQSAMSMVEALRRCPHALVAPPRHERYQEASRMVFAVLRRFTPLVEGLSIDEAFLDVTGTEGLWGDAASAARLIKEAIRRETDLAASVGVAPCKFVAKIASDMSKPDGLLVVAPSDVQSFLAPLPIERMWGIGKKTSVRLRRAGFRTFMDLLSAPHPVLEPLLGSSVDHVQRLARGEDDRAVIADGEAKSVGCENTFEHDLTKLEELEHALLAQSERLASRLVRSGILARAVVVKVKYADFTIRTRRMRLPERASDTDTLYEAARRLLRRFPNLARGVRLTGVAVAELSTHPDEPSLFVDEKAERRRRLQLAVSEITDRFGREGITRATLLRDDDV